MDKKEIYTTYVKDVYRYSYFQLKNKEQAEDITSETFLRLFENKNFNILTTLDKPKAYIIGISRNIIMDHFRNNKKPSYDLETYESTIPNKKENIEDEIINKGLLNILRSKLDHLDDLAKEIIVLKVWEDLQFNEISEILKENISKIKAIYYRTIESLREEFNTSSIKTRSFSLPIVLGIIILLKQQPEYLIRNLKIDQLSNNIFSFNNLSMNNVNPMVSGVSHIAKAGFLASTGAKIAAVGILIVAGIGTAFIGTLIINNRVSFKNPISYSNSSSLSQKTSTSITSSINMNSTSSVTNSSSSNILSSSNGVNYSNNRYGVSLNYPSYFIMSSKNNDPVISSQSINGVNFQTFYDKNIIKGNDQAFKGFGLGYDSNSDNYILKDYINKLISNWQVVCKDVNGGDCPSLNIKFNQININGLTAYYTTGWLGVVGPAANTNIFIQYPNSRSILIMSVSQDFTELNNVVNSIKLSSSNIITAKYNDCKLNYTYDKSLFTFQEQNVNNYLTGDSKGMRLISNNVINRFNDDTSSLTELNISCSKADLQGDSLNNKLDDLVNKLRQITTTSCNGCNISIDVLDKNTNLIGNLAYKLHYKIIPPVNSEGMITDKTIYISYVNNYAYFVSISDFPPTNINRTNEVNIMFNSLVYNQN